MMRFLNILFIALAVLVSSCSKPSSPDCFKRAGEVVTVERKLDSFNMIRLDANVSVYLEKSNEFKVQIKAAENLIPKIVTSVSNNTLIIDNKNTCNFVRGYDHHISITVFAPDYKYIETLGLGTFETSSNFTEDTLVARSESGDITLNGKFNQLRTSSHGNGNMYVNCQTNDLQVYMNGTNYLYAEKATITGYLYIETLSIAQAYVTAPENGLFNYHIWKSGNIYYKGNPNKVDGKIDGEGKLIKQ